MSDDDHGDRDRYQVFRSALPESCPSDPTRMVFTADARGRCEVFAWDAVARRARQVTSRPEGTFHCSIDHDADIWWFDEDRDGRGLWRHRPFDHPGRNADPPGLRDVPQGRPRGLAFATDGTVAIGIDDGRTSTLHIGHKGRPAREILRAPGPLTLHGTAPHGDLLAVTGAAPDTVTLLSATGTVTEVLPGTGGRQWCRGFHPDTCDLLLVHETDDQYLLATWSPGTGTVVHDWCPFDTEITARWYPDGHAVLVRQDRHGRSLLHRVDLLTHRRTRITVPPGTVLDAAPLPGGALRYLWTDTAHPPTLQATDDTPLPPVTTGPAPQVPGRHLDLWTPTPDGPVHTLLSLPDPREQAPPVVFLVHGGPADQDRDAYDATVHSLVASGCAVARVNYRGSTGYGPRWRRAFSAGVGHTQVQDLAAVRADLLRRGLVAPAAMALWGVSWGAYLVLLALGTRPGLWQAGVAVKPVADWVAAHRSATPALRALDVRLFGGTPDEVPERYARSSPLGYATRVTAPLLVVGATRDAKCPPDQIRSYLDALDAAGIDHESMWLDTGHDGYDGAAHVAVLRRAMTFLHRHLTGPPRQAGPELPRPPGEPGPAADTAGRAGTIRSVTKGESRAEGHHPQRSARG